MSNRDDDQYSDIETKQRMDEALRRALNTAPKPHKDISGKGSKSHNPPKARINRHQGR